MDLRTLQDTPAWDWPEAETDGFEDPDEVPITQRTFRNIQDSLQKLYFDNTIPKEVRRRILEACARSV